MNSDTYFVRSYLPNPTREYLQRRYEQQHQQQQQLFFSSPRRYAATTIDQTMTLIEEIKTHTQPKSTAFIPYSLSKTTKQSSNNSTLISFPSELN
ncbi:unnamed protein product, partial [Didymodactylos carnosus]